GTLRICRALPTMRSKCPHGIDRAPVNAGALHADLRHPKLLQPIPQHFQIARHRPEGPDLLPRPLARGADQDAGDDRLLMHVQPTTPLNDHLHLRLHPKEGDRDATGIVETLPRVLPVPGGDKKWYLYGDCLEIGGAGAQAVVWRLISDRG